MYPPSVPGPEQRKKSVRGSLLIGQQAATPMPEEQSDLWRGTARELLPCWFTDRILSEPGRFGALLDTRQVLVIDAIKAVRQGPHGMIWLDVELVIPHRKDGFPWGHFPVLKSSAPDRATCSINVAHIVAVVEVDTWELPPLEPTQEQ